MNQFASLSCRPNLGLSNQVPLPRMPCLSLYRSAHRLHDKFAVSVAPVWVLVLVVSLTAGNQTVVSSWTMRCSFIAVGCTCTHDDPDDDQGLLLLHRSGGGALGCGPGCCV